MTEVIQQEWTPEERERRRLGFTAQGMTKREMAQTPGWTVPQVRASVPGVVALDQTTLF